MDLPTPPFMLMTDTQTGPRSEGMENPLVVPLIVGTVREVSSASKSREAAAVQGVALMHETLGRTVSRALASLPRAPRRSGQAKACRKGVLEAGGP